MPCPSRRWAKHVRKAGGSPCAALMAAPRARARNRAVSAATAGSWTWRRWCGRGAGRFRCRGWKAGCAVRAAGPAMSWFSTSRRAAARHQWQALEVNRRVPIQRDQPRCEPCHTQSEADLDGPVIYPCRWLAKNRHGKSMSRVELNPKTILIASAGDCKNLCKLFAATGGLATARCRERCASPSSRVSKLAAVHRPDKKETPAASAHRG